MARERRHGRSKPRRRRGRFSGLYKLISALLIAAAIVAACVVFFRVNTITVTGNSTYTVQEIVEASGIHTGDNLIALSKSRVAARVRIGLPYVRSVSIGRVFPDTVVLTVTEHRAAAAIRDGSGNWWYLSASGKVLERVSTPGGVMTIAGLTAENPMAGDALAVPEERESRRAFVVALLTQLEERGLLADCSRLDCSSAGVLMLDYLGFHLKMPSTGDFGYMLSMLDGAFESGRVDKSGSGTFDFTVAEGKVYFRRS